MAEAPKSGRSGGSSSIDFLIKMLQFAGNAGFYAYFEQVAGPTFVVLLKALLDALSVLAQSDDFWAAIDGTSGEPWDGASAALLAKSNEDPGAAAMRLVRGAALSRGYDV